MKVKRSIRYLRIIFTVLPSCLLFSFLPQDENKIKKIREAVEKINKDTSYTTRTLNNEAFMENMTDGGGELIGYFKKGKLVKITEKVGFSSCMNAVEYFLEDGQLIFVFVQGKEFRYIDSSSSFDYSESDVTMECRFYFDKGRVIESVSKGSTRCGGSAEANWANAYFNNFLKYKDLFTMEAISYTYSDGNNNVYKISPDSIEYIPVKKENSSSGFYSGGEPAKKAITPDEFSRVQEMVKAIAANKSIHIKDRVMGSGRIVINRDEKKDQMILFKDSEEKKALEKLLKEILNK